MPYDPEVDTRIRSIVDAWSNIDAKKMFGGVCHLQNGNMVCGVYKEFLILRLGAESAQEALQKEHVRPFDITGRVMKGWVMVAPRGFSKKTDLRNWLNQARDFVNTLPPK